MLLNTSKTNQQNLFYSPLSDNMNDPLIALANVIDWKIFEMSLSFYSKDGSPAKTNKINGRIIDTQTIRKSIWWKYCNSMETKSILSIFLWI